MVLQDFVLKLRNSLGYLELYCSCMNYEHCKDYSILSLCDLRSFVYQLCKSAINLYLGSKETELLGLTVVYGNFFNILVN